MKLNCIIIDDIYIARKGLANYVQRISDLNLVGSFNNVYDAQNSLNSVHVDIIYLDIKMSNMSGLDFIRLFKPHQMIILTTAYSEFAVEAFDLNVLDYLLKPITFKRFLQSFKKACQRVEDRLNEKGNEEEFYFIKKANKIQRINIEDIHFIKAFSNYVKIYTQHESHIEYGRISDYLKKFEKYNFIIIHRSYIINVNKLISIEGKTCKVGVYNIPYSLSRKSELLKHLK